MTDQTSRSDWRARAEAAAGTHLDDQFEWLAQQLNNALGDLDNQLLYVAEHAGYAQITKERAEKAETRADLAERLASSVERAYDHGNLDFDLEDAWEAYAVASRALSAASPVPEEGQ